MDDAFDVKLRTAVYRHFASTGRSPTLDTMRQATGATSEQASGYVTRNPAIGSEGTFG
jgi:hypothetical protein